MNPYKVLGVRKDATTPQIRAAFRKLSKTKHPDTGGSEEAFNELTSAYDILMDADRRKRYDEYGRIDKSKVSDEHVYGCLAQAIGAVVDADSLDDPTWTNVQAKVTAGLRDRLTQARAERARIERLLKRADKLAKRFKLKKGEVDLIGDILKKKQQTLRDQLSVQDDAIEMGTRVLQVFQNYEYEVGPDAEGQDAPEPTTRRTSGGILFIR